MNIRNELFRLWWYNNIRRPWANWRLRRMWIQEGRPPEKFYGVGRISPETMEWATREGSKIASLSPLEREDLLARSKTWAEFRAQHERQRRSQ